MKTCTWKKTVLLALALQFVASTAWASWPTFTGRKISKLLRAPSTTSSHFGGSKLHKRFTIKSFKPLKRGLVATSCVLLAGMVGAAALLGTPSSCQAELRKLTATWSFDISAGQSGGFNIYQGGKKVCSTSDVRARSMVCEVDVNPGSNIFTMTYFQSNGNESPHSLPYDLKVPPKSPQNTSPGGK